MRDFTKKQETPEQVAAREKFNQLIGGKEPVPSQEVAKLVASNPKSSAYDAITAWAHNHEIINENPQSPRAKLFAKLMERLETYKGAALYRGLRFKTRAARQAFINKINADNGFTNEEIGMSTSKNESTANDFSADPFGVTMEILPHHSGRDFESFTHEIREIGIYAHEQEVLFLKGSKFKLIKMTESNGRPHMILEELE